MSAEAPAAAAIDQSSAMYTRLCQSSLRWHAARAGRSLEGMALSTSRAGTRRRLHSAAAERVRSAQPVTYPTLLGGAPLLSLRSATPNDSDYTIRDVEPLEDRRVKSRSRARSRLV